MTEPLKLAIVTDIHHGEDKLTKRGSAALGLLDNFFAFAGDWGADLIVDLGDRISDIDAETDRGLMQDVARKFQGLNTPQAHVNGNHDVAFLGEDANLAQFREPAGGRVLELKGWRLIFWMADAFIPGSEPFRLRDADLDWLEAELPKSDLPTVIFTHVPLSGASMVGNYWFQNNPAFAGYPNADAARELIETQGHVALCVAGHVHWNSLHRAGAVPHLTLQSLTESFATSGEAAGAWGALELGDEIRWRVHGDDPIEMVLPMRQPGETWPTPLRKFRRVER
jgi:Icc protein